MKKNSLDVSKAKSVLAIISKTRESLLFGNADTVNGLVAFLHIAQTIGSKDDVDWADLEINGHRAEEDVPKYRKNLQGRYVFDNVPAETESALEDEKYFPIRADIPRLAEILTSQKDDSIIFNPSNVLLEQIKKKFKIEIPKHGISISYRRAGLVKLLTDVNIEIITRLQNLETTAIKFLQKHEKELPPEEKIKRKFHPKKIFIVHGKNEKARNDLVEILNRLKLEPIVLMDKPNEGKTLIEKFENNSLNVGYAFILLTPDDLGCLESDFTEKKDDLEKAIKLLKPRARENVGLELGYFAGNLGRSRVCCIQKGNTDLLPSDLHGLVTIRYNESVKDKYIEIEDELKKAGYVK